MSDLAFAAGVPAARHPATAPPTAAALRFRRAVRPLCRREDDAGAGALLHGVAVADDVVEAPPPSRRRCCPVRSSDHVPSILICEFLAPYDLTPATPISSLRRHSGSGSSTKAGWSPRLFMATTTGSTWTTSSASIRRTRQTRDDPLLLPRRRVSVLGVVPGDLHLVCPATAGSFFCSAPIGSAAISCRG